MVVVSRSRTLTLSHTLHSMQTDDIDAYSMASVPPERPNRSPASRARRAQADATRARQRTPEERAARAAQEATRARQRTPEERAARAAQDATRARQRTPEERAARADQARVARQRAATSRRSSVVAAERRPNRSPASLAWRAQADATSARQRPPEERAAVGFV